MSVERRKALVFGKNGQLAWELLRTAPEDFAVTALGSREINILDAAQVTEVIESYAPDLVINAAAYTAVDKAEVEQQAAYDLNQRAVANIAEALIGHVNTAFVHVSTDFVFNGQKSTPYTETDDANPISVYGASKLAGEKEIQNRNLARALILRTSWVYSSHGNNFVKTMLRLMSEGERAHLNVVADQIGTPTWAFSLARAIWHAGHADLESPEPSGTKISNWTDAGVASWYDFAIAIQELAIEKGLLEKIIPVYPIPQIDFPSQAPRPAFSVLDKTNLNRTFGQDLCHWRKQLAMMLDELSGK
ncbi:dTDP-4-dehydrorhamnose reductase [Microbulbifer sp. ALW1]|uniref:dTDP-4-dehydrorhamnose reductase n=1 Tax=Microbulbifer sp. (strain ALW1) TaxID=1516059 RepID=UPI00135B9A0B|nr:dTDP-4-dehydrorhamnose reductase [Microbulbifer sp. ALW1]